MNNKLNPSNNIASYRDQLALWPQTGQHILAQYDSETIFIYQAYSPKIAEYAIANGLFGGDFSYSRMSWIKPNFLWMMYRSNWGTSSGQETVLALRLRRSFFDRLLEEAVESSWNPARFDSREAWSAAVAKSDVRLQWDPDHWPTGDKCERRAVQLGLRGAILEQYGKREILEVINMSDFIANQREHAPTWNDGRLMTPLEFVYLPLMIPKS
jgi:hypothetical protein